MTELIEKDGLKVILTAVIHELQGILAPGVKLTRMPDGSLVSNGNARHLLRSFIRGGSFEKVLRTMVVEACEKTETLGPGSTWSFINVLQSLVNGSALSPSLKDALGKISSSSRPIRRSSVDAIIRRHVPDVADVILESMDLAGSECKIFVEASPTHQTMVERIEGHTFRCEPDPLLFSSGRWTAYDVKCLIVDGVIERVSEIDSLLQRSHADKRPLIIFARGFDRDVISTLHTNHVRRTLNVMPVNVRFDLETVNVLSDIATVIGGDVVSSLKGELISTTSYDSLRTARSVTCQGQSATLTCDKAPSVAVHLDSLIQKRRNETIPAIKQILDQRIRSLSSSSVVIRVDASGSNGSRLMHEIDEGLRLLRSLLIHGIVTFDVLGPNLEFLAPIVGPECSTIGLKASLQVALSLFSALSSVKLGVSVENPSL